MMCPKTKGIVIVVIVEVVDDMVKDVIIVEMDVVAVAVEDVVVGTKIDTWVGNVTWVDVVGQCSQ